MDNMMKYKENAKSIESTTTTTRKEFEDGSSEETRVEQVEGGYIITKEFSYDQPWQYVWPRFHFSRYWTLRPR